MSCCFRNSQLRHTVQDTTFSTQVSIRYYSLFQSVIVPVFCACMISAMGLISGLRQVVFMQFASDADTEHIKSGVCNRMFASLYQAKYQTKSFTIK